MMVYLIIFCAIALVLGSWMWVMPSPREKALATLRQNAIMAGFQVKFVTADSYQALLGTARASLQTKPQSQIVRYSWQGKSPNPHGKEKHQLCVFSEDGQMLVKQERISGGTASEEFQRAAQALAAELEGLLAVEVQEDESKRLLSFYWLEQGNVAKTDFHSSAFEQLKIQPF